MKPTSNWERTQAQMGLSSEQLAPGGHTVRIMGAEVRNSKAGREMLVLFLDVKEGSQYDGIFQRKWQNNKGFGRTNWPNDGTMYTLTADKDGNTNPRFKGLIQAVSESNSGFEWRWDENSLKGKMLGVVFGEEEFVGQNDGQIHVAVKPKYVCPVSKIDEQPVPKIRKVQEDAVSESEPVSDNFTEVQDDELPF